MKKTPACLFLATIMLLLGSCSKSSNNNNNNTTCSNGPICKPVLGSGQTAGTTPAGIVGTHTLTYDEIQTGAPFPDGATATFQLTSDNKLVVTYNGQCVTIENPRQTSTSEVTFRDECLFNVHFAASEKNTGGLNEVNINALTGTFYGQFK